MNSRNKGKRGELLLVRVLREFGFDCRRGQQFCGANGDADVVGLPGIHIECKYVERLNLYDAIAQAVHDALAYATYDKSALQWNRFVKDFCADPRTANIPDKLKTAALLWSKVRESTLPKVYDTRLLDEYVKV